jgi:methyltransferase family protein
VNWRAKALVQKALSALPAGQQLHHALQRRVGSLSRFDDELQTKLEDWRLMAGHLRGAGQPIAGARLLEIGSGWYPTLPFALYLAGAARVITVDITRHMMAELVRRCAEGLAARAAAIAAASGAPEAEVRRRGDELVARLRGTDVEAATGGVVEYRAPGDARRTGLPAASLDVVFSNSVLEHIPAEAIREMFVEARRVLAPGRIMFHSVNCGDHYAYADSRITQLNYLRYSETEWRLWNNDFTYQNRMRAHEFTAMARDAGFAIELDTTTPTPARLRELAAIPVHPAFRARFTPEQLCVTTVDFIARKAAG